METTTFTEARIAALAKHWDCDADDVTDEGDNRFSIGSQEFLVLTDDEADARARESIKDTVWAFNADFLCGHMAKGKLSPDDIDRLRGDKCESINDAFLALIDDFEAFAKDAISADGRGHFLAGYDFEENEVDGFFIYREN